MRCQQFLVGGHDVAPPIKRALDELGGFGDAADHLDHEIHARVVDKRRRIEGQ